MTEPKDRSVILSWTPGDDHNSPVLGICFSCLVNSLSVCSQYLMHVNLLYNLIIFSPFKCQMLDMVEKLFYDLIQFLYFHQFMIL